jgi:hypothetical protein
VKGSTLGFGIDIKERERLSSVDEGDHERFAHIVWTPGKDAGAVLMHARLNGTPVTALCGKKWVPSRDPEKFPICPECKAIREGRR